MASLLGQPVRLTFETFADPARTVLADPTVVAVTVQDPTGAQISHAWPSEPTVVVRDALGQFHIDVTPTGAGRHEAYFTAAGTLTTAHDQVFYVRAPFAGGVGLDEVRAYLVMDDPLTSEDEDKVQFFLDAANEWIAKRVAVQDLNAAPVRMATVELVREMWDTQRGPAAGLLDQEDFATSRATAIPVSIPPRVRAMIGPYLRGKTATGSFPPAMPFEAGFPTWNRW